MFFDDAEDFRAWLEANHDTATELWMGLNKKHVEPRGLTWAEAVREALCFGWIDSLIKRLDEDRYALKLTPRKPGSKWSDLNRKRWSELKAAGQLKPAGLAAAPTDNTYAPRPHVPELPDYIAKAIRANAKAWKFFQKLPPRERRDFVVWIHIAKRPETRERRIHESIKLLAAGKKLGLK